MVEGEGTLGKDIQILDMEVEVEVGPNGDRGPLFVDTQI